MRCFFEFGRCLEGMKLVVGMIIEWLVFSRNRSRWRVLIWLFSELEGFRFFIVGTQGLQFLSLEPIGSSCVYSSDHKNSKFVTIRVQWFSLCYFWKFLKERWPFFVVFAEPKGLYFVVFGTQGLQFRH